MDVEFNKPLPSLPQFQFAYPGIFYDNEVTVNYLIDKEVFIIPTLCPECGGHKLSRATIYFWQCTRKGCRGGKSCMDGSFFSGCKSVGLVLLAARGWLSGAAQHTVRKDTGLGDNTVRKWRMYLQELIMFDVLATPEEEMMLGGPNWLTGEHSIVEIDESKFGKRKFHVGHIVEGVWVVGLIERSRPGYKGKFVVEKVANRGADTLEMLILKYVRPGSCLYSDKWKGYRTYTLFEQQQLLHRTVNHTYNFKDPVTGVHTNTIEGMWGHMKSAIPRQSRTEDKIEQHLWEFMWRRTHANLWDCGLVRSKH